MNQRPETGGYGSLSPEARPNVSPAPVVNFTRNVALYLFEYPHGRGRIVLLFRSFHSCTTAFSGRTICDSRLNVVTGNGVWWPSTNFIRAHATHQCSDSILRGHAGPGDVRADALLGLMVIWSRGSRFGRPLPLPKVDRRSSLEFVASMAELQHRARAHDLALENIYGRVRRVLVRHAGLSNSSPRAEIAARVAARSRLNRQELETLMRNCEDTITSRRMRKSAEHGRTPAPD